MDFGKDAPDSIDEILERCKNDTRKIEFQITANDRKEIVVVKIAKPDGEVASPNAFNASLEPIELVLLKDDISRVNYSKVRVGD